MSEDKKENEKLFTYSKEDAKHSRIQDDRFSTPRVTLHGKLANNIQMFETKPNPSGKVYVNIYSSVQHLSKRNNETTSVFHGYKQFTEKNSPLHLQYLEIKEKYDDIKKENPYMPVVVKGVVENTEKKLSVFNPETNQREETDDILYSKQIKGLNSEIKIESKNHNHSAVIELTGTLTKPPFLNPKEYVDENNNTIQRDALAVNLETENTYNNKTTTTDTTVWISNSQDVRTILDMDLKQGDKMFVKAPFYEKEKSMLDNRTKDYVLSTTKDSIIEVQQKDALPVIVRGLPHKASLLKDKKKNITDKINAPITNYKTTSKNIQAI